MIPFINWFYQLLESLTFCTLLGFNQLDTDTPTHRAWAVGVFMFGWLAMVLAQLIHAYQWSGLRIRERGIQVYIWIPIENKKAQKQYNAIVWSLSFALPFIYCIILLNCDFIAAIGLYIVLVIIGAPATCENGHGY